MLFLWWEIDHNGTCGQTWLSSFSTFCFKNKVSWIVLRAVILPLSLQSKIQLIQRKTIQLWFLYICCIKLFLSKYNTLANVHTYIILYFKWHSILILNLFLLSICFTFSNIFSLYHFCFLFALFRSFQLFIQKYHHHSKAFYLFSYF